MVRFFTGSGGTIAAGTTNTIAKYTNSSSLGDSSMVDNGTIVTIAEPVTYSGNVAGSASQVGGNGSGTLQLNCAIGQAISFQNNAAQVMRMSSTGLMSVYNSITTAGACLSFIVAENDVFAQTADVASLMTYTPVTEGTFDIDCYFNVTVASTGTTLTVSYTDHNGVAQSDPIPLITPAAAVSAGTITTATRYYGHANIRAKSTTAILVFTTGYLTGTYDLGGSIKCVEGS